MPKWLKKKKKEQANVANDGDETDSIGTEKCLTINGYDLSDYLVDLIGALVVALDLQGLVLRLQGLYAIDKGV